MTATDPRPALAAMPAERLAPAAEALAMACARDADPELEEAGYDGSEGEFHCRSEVYVGKLATPEFRAWDEPRMRRLEEGLAADFDPDEDDPGSGGKAGAAAGAHDET